MARHRKSHSQNKNTSHNESSSSSGTEDNGTNRGFKGLSMCKTIFGALLLVVAVYVGTIGYLETRVNTPLDEEKAVQLTGLNVPERYWGTYRPGVYFGLKNREPRSPVFGMMWYELTTAAHKGIRHWCEQGDNLQSYTWLYHDGVTFGEQILTDLPHNIHTSFIKSGGGERGGQWTARINVTSTVKRRSPFVLVWYVALDESLGQDPESRIWVEQGAILGHTPVLKNFKIQFIPYEGSSLHTTYAEAHAPGLHQLKEKFHSLLRIERHSKLGRLATLGVDDVLIDKEKTINFIPVQMLVEAPFVLDVVYTTDERGAPQLRGDDYTRHLRQKKAQFDERFEQEFKLKEKGYSEEEVVIARSALSNMIGGVGYFYGAGRVRSTHTREPVPYWRAPLYTAVPSRSFFPRGFLWDEGFHGLLIGRWSLDIQMDIAAHWLDLINVEGWIPREQILGVEALARVPKEFVVQSNAAANPPMLLLQIAQMVKRNPKVFQRPTPHRQTLDRMFPRLQAWYQWFQNTQKGDEATAYRWRGREDDGLQLNPKTLTSGLDDYPRASHPSSIERHVDLRCWMYAAADAMVTISKALDRDYIKFEVSRQQLSDEELLNELHWSSHAQLYADYGLHTDDVRLEKRTPRNKQEPPKTVRVVRVPPQPRLVVTAVGYVSLFPMLMKVLQPTSPNLGKILDMLDKPELLWSPYGLRSLSKSSPLYMKRNTEHDPPYWRGQVWLSINYLALSALRHYALVAGPHAERAHALHAQLRDNLVRNVLSEYKRTGYLWEQYSAEDGRGSGCRPFTGWTALIVLTMAEEY